MCMRMRLCVCAAGTAPLAQQYEGVAGTKQTAYVLPGHYLGAYRQAIYRQCLRGLPSKPLFCTNINLKIDR